MRTSAISYFLIRLLAAAAICAASGCRGERPPQGEPLDTSYLASPPQRRQVAFDIVFARYEDVEAPVMEEGWALLDGPEEETAELWAANGLRIGWTAAEGARALRRVLKRLGTLESTERRFIMPSRQSIDVELGRAAAMGLVYETSHGKAYEDVVDLELGLLLKALHAPGPCSVSLSPFFAAGDGQITALKGMDILLPVESAEMILIGPAADVPHSRLGELMLREQPAASSRSLVIIECEITR